MAEILFVGDIHLGRSPSRLPAELAQHGVDASDLGPAAAFRAVVAHALRRRPAAVVFAGDVVEAANARFEAYAHLRPGVEEMTAAGIDVCAVAGNHDVEVLPRLADELPGFRLLGRGGRWEWHGVESDGKVIARLLGWSFPERRVTASPLATLPPPAVDGPPVLGVLHCDLDVPQSPYAPVPSSALSATHPSGWFLGHVHKPSLGGGGRPLGYLGSLVGLDPTETGVHGPWTVEVGSGGIVSVRQEPLAPLRWEQIDVSLDGLDDPDEGLLKAVIGALKDLDGRIGPTAGDARVVGVRMRLTGRVARHREVAAAVARLPDDRPILPSGGRVYFLDKAVDDTAPARDLQALAKGNDPVALLAADLLCLERGDGSVTGLLDAARRELPDVAARPAFAVLDPWEPTDDELRELLLRSGRTALEGLLAQQEGRA